MCRKKYKIFKIFFAERNTLLLKEMQKEGYIKYMLLLNDKTGDQLRSSTFA